MRMLEHELEYRRINGKQSGVTREAADKAFVDKLVVWMTTDRDWFRRSLSDESVKLLESIWEV